MGIERKLLRINDAALEARIAASDIKSKHIEALCLQINRIHHSTSRRVSPNWSYMETDILTHVYSSMQAPESSSTPFSWQSLTSLSIQKKSSQWQSFPTWELHLTTACWCRMLRTNLTCASLGMLIIWSAPIKMSEIAVGATLIQKVQRFLNDVTKIPCLNVALLVWFNMAEIGLCWSRQNTTKKCWRTTSRKL